MSKVERVERISTKSIEEEKKKVFTWTEPNPHPAYLTSVVIGKFVERREMYNHYSELLCYVPEGKKNDAKRSFEHTADMIRFFEEYFDTNIHTASIRKLQLKILCTVAWKTQAARR